MITIGVTENKMIAMTVYDGLKPIVTEQMDYETASAVLRVLREAVSVLDNAKENV